VKALKWFGISIGIIVVVLVIGLGYLGFIPGVSNLFGSNKPKDLGVTYTVADYTSARNKVGGNLSVLPSTSDPTQSISFSGSHPVDVNFTEAEYNAELNNRQWSYYPLENVQVKLHTDGTAELSANIETGKLQGCLEALGASQDALTSVTNYLKYIPTNPAIYMKGSVEIENGEFLNTDMATFKVGNLDLTGQIQNNLSQIISGGESTFNYIPGFSIKTFQIVNIGGNPGIHFVGTEPDCARSIVSP